LKQAAERLGVEPPSKRQLRGLKLMGLVAPPASAGMLARIRGIVLVVLAVILIFAVAYGLVKLVTLATGSLSTDLSIFWAFVVVVVAVGTLVLVGRRRQKRAQAERAEQIAARSR
ncbi:MAG TPA: hypothetical protein VII87_14745, partial [Solirubrobacteraceae bacterium]